MLSSQSLLPVQTSTSVSWFQSDTCIRQFPVNPEIEKNLFFMYLCFTSCFTCTTCIAHVWWEITKIYLLIYVLSYLLWADRHKVRHIGILSWGNWQSSNFLRIFLKLQSHKLPWCHCCWAWRPPLAIDISCPHGAQQQTRHTLQLPLYDETDTGPLHRPWSTYCAGVSVVSKYVDVFCRWWSAVKWEW